MHERNLAGAAWLQACAAVPGVLVVAATAVMLAMAAAERHPLWPHGVVTLPEAAALRDAGEVALLIARGADPNAPDTIRRGMLFDRRARLTPLQAAVAAERAEIVALLLRRGASPGDEEWTELVCRARREGVDDVARVLTEWRPGVTAACGNQ